MKEGEGADHTNLTMEAIHNAFSRLDPLQTDRVFVLNDKYGPFSARHFEQIVRDFNAGLEYVCGCPNNPAVVAFRADGSRLIYNVCKGKERPRE